MNSTPIPTTTTVLKCMGGADGPDVQGADGLDEAAAVSTPASPMPAAR